jgi:hypothetical protein
MPFPVARQSQQMSEGEKAKRKKGQVT